MSPLDVFLVLGLRLSQTWINFCYFSTSLLITCILYTRLDFGFYNSKSDHFFFSSPQDFRREEIFYFISIYIAFLRLKWAKKRTQNETPLWTTILLKFIKIGDIMKEKPNIFVNTKNTFKNAIKLSFLYSLVVFITQKLSIIGVQYGLALLFAFSEKWSQPPCYLF